MHPLAQNIAGKALFFLLWILALGFFAFSLYQIFRFMKKAQPDDRLSNIPERIKAFITFVLGQKRLLNEPFPGLLHIFIFWGFIILNLAVLLDFGEGLMPWFAGIRSTAFYLYFSFVVDLLSLLVLFAVILALFRRFILNIPRLEKTWESALILCLIAAIVLSDFCIAGIRLNLEPVKSYSLGANVAKYMFNPLSGIVQGNLLQFYWWIHLLFILGFLVYLPYSKHSHIIFSPFNVFLRNLGVKGALKLIPDIENAERFGAAALEELSWKDVFDMYSCVQCGRCQDYCPAFNTGKPLSPKKLLHDLRENLKARKDELLGKAAVSEKAALIPNAVSPDELWACTTCSACQEQCPIFIEHLPKIMELRRNQVLVQSQFPPEVVRTFKNIETNSNPWGIGYSTRGDWAAKSGVKTLAENPQPEYLYFVGCAGSFDERNLKISAAFAKILQAAGINFAVLGAEEACCGDPARRIGNEYLYQILAQQNIATFKQHNVSKIITACPHCFNTLKNEYPQLGGEFEVRHAAEFIAELLQAGKLKLQAGSKAAVCYHDSCYLGRYNQIYQEPRAILQALGYKLKEMRHHKDKSFCCGAGGGRMWMEETIGTRINDTRTQEALNTGSESIAVACPFCLTMLEDGLKDLGKTEKLQVRDITELVAERLG